LFSSKISKTSQRAVPFWMSLKLSVGIVLQLAGCQKATAPFGSFKKKTPQPVKVRGFLFDLAIRV
jgi:hypothetical protein